ncbi:hypothetical protein BS50DRAFT_668223 [Corynespora cassiicola Philippines]|uniref:Uncharacterized protein n=1 Tax=Corynespora cassiicola Philippines TaxID=1448308 RepID=A0A2T2NJU5_CORCC|nr:hypothetical protein BS50DRAFT_668223 [Corynespora cassiicola Philippines]
MYPFGYSFGYSSLYAPPIVTHAAPIIPVAATRTVGILQASPPRATALLAPAPRRRLELIDRPRLELVDRRPPRLMLGAPDIDPDDEEEDYDDYDDYDDDDSAYGRYLDAKEDYEYREFHRRRAAGYYRPTYREGYEREQEDRRRPGERRERRVGGGGGGRDVTGQDRGGRRGRNWNWDGDGDAGKGRMRSGAPTAGSNPSYWRR